MNALDGSAQQALKAVLGRHLARGGMALAATHVALDLPGARNLELGTAR